MNKLCFVMLQFKMGGCERVFSSLSSIISTPVYLFTIKMDYDARLLDELPSNVHLVTFKNKRAIQALLNCQKNKVISPILQLLIVLMRLFYLWNRFYKQGICFVNFSDTLSSLFVTYILRRLCLNSSNISWVHCNPLMLRNSKCYFLYKYCLCHCNKIVCICNEQKDVLFKLIPSLDFSRISILHNAINLSEIQEKAEESEPPVTKPYLLMVSRIDLRSKDFFMLIDAYAALPIYLQDTYHLYIVGDGDDKQRVKQYINEKKLSNKIVLYGSDSNPFRWMKHCSLFLFTSKSEGFPTVLLEAMACGAFIISTDCLTGPKEILENGKNGILVPIGDASALNKKMVETLSETFDKSSFLNSSKQRIIDFDLDSVARKLVQTGIFNM